MYNFESLGGNIYSPTGPNESKLLCCVGLHRGRTKVLWLLFYLRQKWFQLTLCCRPPFIRVLEQFNLKVKVSDYFKVAKDSCRLQFLEN